MAQQQVLGMDTEEGRRVARDMNEGSAQIGDVIGSASAIAGRINEMWPGADGARFGQDVAEFVGNAQNAAQSLSDQARQLVVHADRQDQASA